LEERGKIVCYTTSMQVVRNSYEKSKRLKKMMLNYGVRYEEKDLYKHKHFQKELKYRMNQTDVNVPHVFFDGKYIGVTNNFK
jgi:glutaredoxin